MITHRVMINGIEVDARYSRRAVDDIFLPLLRRLTALHREKGRRILVLLAAPPGAGKTTLLTFLERLSKEQPDTEPIQVIGMAMVEIKGAPVTFDLDGLKKAVKKLAAGEYTGWPVYDRMLHNPVEDAVRVDGGIVLLEGNYLLLDEDGWRDLRDYADYTIKVTADENFLRDRLIDRKIKSGNTKEKAIHFVDYSDMANVRICLNNSAEADMTLTVSNDGEYLIT